jgi:iron complex outermembrane receptor protein
VQLNKRNGATATSLNNKQDDNVPLKNILAAFEKKYNINIVYRESIVQNKMVAAFKTDSYHPDTALKALLTPLGLTFKKITATQIIITVAAGAKAGEKGATGAPDDKQNL